MMYSCKRKDDEWDSILTRINLHKNHLSYTAIGHCMSVRTIVGWNEGVLWICFPDKEVSCTLAHPDDIFWNTEKLIHLLNSEKEGITIARSIQELKDALYIMLDD